METKKRQRRSRKNDYSNHRIHHFVDSLEDSNNRIHHFIESLKDTTPIRSTNTRQNAVKVTEKNGDLAVFQTEDIAHFYNDEEMEVAVNNTIQNPLTNLQANHHNDERNDNDGEERDNEERDDNNDEERDDNDDDERDDNSEDFDVGHEEDYSSDENLDEPNDNNQPNDELLGFVGNNDDDSDYWKSESVESTADKGGFNYFTDYIAVNNFAILQDKKNLPADNDIQFPGSNHPSKTIGCFMRDMSDFFKTFALSNDAEAYLMCLLLKYVPKIPVAKTRAGNYKSSLNLYEITGSKYTTFDVCPNECTVYIGNQSNNRSCSICLSPRYTRCANSKCSHLTTDTCVHKVRTSLRQVYYRPVTPLIHNLLKQPGFLHAINYHYQKPGVTAEYELMDIRDGSVAMNDLEQMRAKYFAETSKDINFTNYIPVNIIMSEFTDGIKVHNHKSTKFKPMIVTILNLPPNYRNKIGTGTFLITIFDGSDRTAVQDLLYKCFIDEMLEFEKGLVLEVDKQKYFVQIRLNLHIADSKELETLMNVQGSGSHAGCAFCNSGYGISKRDSLKKVYYPGGIEHTPLDNFLRSFGQSGKNYPINYFTTENGTDKNLRMQQFQPVVRSDYKVQRVQVKTLVPTFCSSAAASNIIAMLSNDAQYSSFHGDLLDMNVFNEFLYFHHCTYENVKEYRVKSDEMFKYEADLLQRHNARAKYKKERYHHWNGVKGDWVFRPLHSSKLHNNGFDPFHTSVGVIKNMIHLLRGTRPTETVTPGLKEYLKLTNSHPQIVKGGKGPWLIHTNKISTIEAIFNSINIPKGYTNILNVTFPFTKSDQVRGADAIAFIAVLGNLTMHYSNVPEAYKSLVYLFALDLNDMLSPTQSNDAIDDLFDRMIELVGLMHGLFPASESLFMVHALYCMVPRIKLYGPVQGFWGFSGERSLPAIKKHITRGGRNMNFTVINRFLKQEHCQSKESYSFTINCISKGILNDPCVMRVRNNAKANVYFQHTGLIDQHNTTKQLVYDDFKTMLLKPTVINRKFTEHEMDRLLYTMIEEIRKQCDNCLEALIRSPLFRMHEAYIAVHKGSRKYFSFLYFLRCLLFFHKDHYKQQSEYYITAIDTTHALELAEIDFINYGDISLTDIVNFTRNGNIYMKDVLSIVTYLCPSVTYYRNAMVFGKKINGRGFEYAERQYIREGQQPKDSLNWLHKTWFYRNQYSSWCKYKVRSSQCNKFGLIPQKKLSNNYAQINFYFRLNLPLDPILNGVPFASIVARKATISKYSVCTIDCKENQSLIVNKIFLPVTDMYSTVVATTAFDNNDRPYRIKVRTDKSTDELEFSSDLKENIVKLIMIDLHPNCFDIKYSNTRNISFNDEYY